MGMILPRKVLQQLKEYRECVRKSGVAVDSSLSIQDANVSLPHMQGVADIEELVLPMQLELVQCFRPRLSPETVELLTCTRMMYPRSPFQPSASPLLP